MTHYRPEIRNRKGLWGGWWSTTAATVRRHKLETSPAAPTAVDLGEGVGVLDACRLLSAPELSGSRLEAKATGFRPMWPDGECLCLFRAPDLNNVAAAAVHTSNATANTTQYTKERLAIFVLSPHCLRGRGEPELTVSL